MPDCPCWYQHRVTVTIITRKSSEGADEMVSHICDAVAADDDQALITAVVEDYIPGGNDEK